MQKCYAKQLISLPVFFQMSITSPSRPCYCLRFYAWMCRILLLLCCFHANSRPKTRFKKTNKKQNVCQVWTEDVYPLQFLRKSASLSVALRSCPMFNVRLEWCCWCFSRAKLLVLKKTNKKKTKLEKSGMSFAGKITIIRKDPHFQSFPHYKCISLHSPLFVLLPRLPVSQTIRRQVPLPLPGDR